MLFFSWRGSQELERGIKRAVHEASRLKAHVDELKDKTDHAHRVVQSNHTQSGHLEAEFQERLRVLAELKMQARHIESTQQTARDGFRARVEALKTDIVRKEGIGT